MIGISCTQFSVHDPNKIMDAVSRDFGLWEIFSEADNTITKFSSRFDDMRSRFSMEYSVHAPICDINIAAVNDKVRETSVKEMMDTLEHANRMGIEMVTIHPGVYSMVLDGLRGRSGELAKDSLRRIEKASAETGVTAAIENMPSFAIMMGQTPEELLCLIDGTDLKVCFDIGHANTMGATDRFIDLLGERIANIHIHDNNGDVDAHMTIGDGNIDFMHVLSKLKGCGGNYIIESRTLESAIESKKRLEAMMRKV
ncbi:MAG: sugar phosphate isomerase/epimerase [Candidatus Methanoplasma sp.]|jgi:sugar phosphate isomerase/epimerase|nr:sugar phosphate isomerase/epimerase [Candidatus Methanoplasma sp.]